MERIDIEYIGLAAGMLTTAAYVPQVYRTWRSKAVGDISLFMYLSMGLGVLLWMTYGVLIKAPAVIIANGLCLTLIGGMLRMKIVYGKLAKDARKSASAQADPSQTDPTQTDPAQAAAGQPPFGQNTSSQSTPGQASGPSLATRLGRGLGQLKQRHRKTWG
jgi:MtN3 and saliva related transmembrane protein